MYIASVINASIIVVQRSNIFFVTGTFLESMEVDCYNLKGNILTAILGFEAIIQYCPAHQWYHFLRYYRRENPAHKKRSRCPASNLMLQV